MTCNLESHAIAIFSLMTGLANEKIVKDLATFLKTNTNAYFY